MADPVSDLSGAVLAAAEALGGAPSREPSLERPPQATLGDYSTNAAMMLAGAVKRPPREVAERMGEALTAELGPALERVEVAGPGFLNLFVSDGWLKRASAAALAAGGDFGRSRREPAPRVNVEFVSANPTGPITVAAGRHAAYGDALCRILAAAGEDVEREYYVNDHGGQVQRFGASIRARARGEEPPQDGYRGEYVGDVAARIGDGAADLADDELAQRGVAVMLESIEATLRRFRVEMDRFSSERALHDGGYVDAAIERLRERGHVYESEGATWLRSTALGDDKDRVLRRSNGETTYFAADIAYHEGKRERGYDHVVAVLGADHHGYLARMRAAWQALGGDPARLEHQVMQLVNLLEGGRRAQMSKRGGQFVTLDELIDDIGVDATRWFLLQRSHDTTLDVDLELARRRSQDNPVYYAQYAHARIASILRRAGAERVEAALAGDPVESAERLHPSARELVKKLLELPGEVRVAAERRAPHRIVVHVTEAAQAFSAFYRDCKVVGAADEGGDEALRIALCELTRRNLATSLDLLGIEAPDEM